MGLPTDADANLVMMLYFNVLTPIERPHSKASKQLKRETNFIIRG